MKFFVRLAVLFFVTPVFAQSYLVTLKGDTLLGEVRILSYDLMDRLQLGEGKKKSTLTALQVRQATINGESYVPVKFENNIRMMKVIRRGYLSLYAFRMPNQMNYDGRILVKIGSPPQEVPNLGFKRYVGNLVEDCPAVADRVRNGDLERRNVETLVDEYNKCIEALTQRRFDNSEFKERNATIDFIVEMRTRVQGSQLASKSEVLDLLSNMTEKVRKKEPVPSYMKEGLKSYLSQQEEFKADVDQLLLLLGN